MTSDVRYKYYECFIDNANENMLNSIKEDVFFDRNANKLNLHHYMKLSRLIIKRKKAINKDKKIANINSL